MADAQPQDEGVSVTAQAPTIHARVSIPSPVVIVAAGEVSSAPVDTTSLGPVTRTITIKDTVVTQGLHQYEAFEDGKLVWDGMGDDPVEGLLKIIIRLTEGEDPSHPNN